MNVWARFASLRRYSEPAIGSAAIAPRQCGKSSEYRTIDSKRVNRSLEYPSKRPPRQVVSRSIGRPAHETLTIALKTVTVGALNQDEFAIANLHDLFQQTPELALTNDSKIIIFSDLHLGNGGRNDDFRSNAAMFVTALERYLEAGFTLVLNGDIEELQRFRLPAIHAAWPHVYRLFSAFESRGEVYRLVGNHDLDLLRHADRPEGVREAVRFNYEGGSVFVFHGHQTSRRYARYNRLIGVGLRFLANPLSIRNYSVSHDSRRRFSTEERVYQFASGWRILSIIGHTHRPLFESMSKVDSIKFEIERLCRKYPKASETKQAKIASTIETHKAELKRIDEHNDDGASVASLYNANLVVPCVFNSGTVIGKRGMTGLEIQAGRIRLLHWFDERRSHRYLRYSAYETRRLEGTDYHQVEIKSESLDYIFARINLLA